MIRRCGQRVPRQIGNRYSKTGVGRERPLFSYRDGKGNAGGKAQERLRPARNILRLHFDLTTGKPLGLDKLTGDRDVRERAANELELRIIRVRERDIKRLDRTPGSIEYRFDPGGRLAGARCADDVRGNTSARLHPTTKFFPGQNVAYEDAFGTHRGRNVDRDVMGGPLAEANFGKNIAVGSTSGNMEEMDDYVLPSKRMSPLRRAWSVFGVAVVCAAGVLAAIWITLHKDDPHFINYAAALIPGVFSFFFGFIPDVRERHVAWRIGILSLGILWSVVLWRQQIITERDQGNAITGAVNTAVDKSNKHSDEKFESVKSDLGTVRDDLKGQIGTTNGKLVELSSDLRSGNETLSNAFKTVKPFTPGKAKLIFSLWRENVTDDEIPVMFQTIQGSKEQSFKVSFFMKNISDESAGKGDMWVTICAGCKFVKEPDGFVKRKGADEHVRNRPFEHLESGISFEKMEIEISVPDDAPSIQATLTYSCDNCPPLKDNRQDFTIYTVRQ